MQLQLPPDVSFCTITSNLCIREQNTRGKKYRNEQAVPLDVAPERRTMANHSEIWSTDLLHSNTGRCPTLCLCLNRQGGREMSAARPHDLTSVCSCPIFESISIYIDSNLSRLFLPYGIYNLSWCDVHFSFKHALFQKSACIGTKYMKFVPVLILKLSHYVCASYAYISQRIFFLEKFINVFSTLSQSLELNWSGKRKAA